MKNKFLAILMICFVNQSFTQNSKCMNFLIFETIQIPSSPIPYNQIRVKLIFEDQSSMIQKTGIK